MNTHDTAGPMPAAVPRRVVLAAHAVPLVVLPSGLWRVGVLLALPGFGTAEARAQHWHTDLYMVVLAVLSEGLALLTLGLVRPWGEVVPGWVPVIGGWRPRRRAVTATALTGALALTVLTVGFAVSLAVSDFPPGHSAVEQALLSLCYLPLLAWGPLLAVVALAYHRRGAPGRTRGA
ncbi:hypothetical protein JNUCC64_02880 [Streptomyces sp. JNUCC 64]